MTFEEALFYKNRLPEFTTVSKRNFLAKHYVVPEIGSDLVEWVLNFDSSKTTDEDAKKYSTNNKYSIHTKAV